MTDSERPHLNEQGRDELTAMLLASFFNVRNNSRLRVSLFDGVYIVRL